MMTTFKAMRRLFPAKALIIGVAALALAGCSAVRLGYDNGPWLARWWIDDWLDLRSEQVQPLDDALQAWFAWHRRSELPGYADALAALARRAGGELSAADMCRINDEWRARIDRAVEQALPATARLLPSIRPEQWAQFARHEAERRAELRETFGVDGGPERVTQRQLERGIERGEMLYGKLAPAQRELLKTVFAEGPFDPARWLAERAQRQDELLRGLKALQAPGLSPAQRTDGLRALYRRTQTPADPAEQARQQRRIEYGCQASARLHNSTDARQREHLRQFLLTWEADFRALAARAQPAPREAAQGL